MIVKIKGAKWLLTKRDKVIVKLRDKVFAKVVLMLKGIKWLSNKMRSSGC